MYMNSELNMAPLSYDGGGIANPDDMMMTRKDHFLNTVI